MHLITVAYGVSACQLLFKTEDAAKAAWDKLCLEPPMMFKGDGITEQTMETLRKPGARVASNSTVEYVKIPVHVQDDFGRQFFGTVIGAVFENLDLSKEGQIEQALHNAHTQAQAQKRAQTDPKLGGARGPAILSPMGGGNGRVF